MRVLAMLPVAVALKSTADHIASMKSAFKSVAEKAKKNGGVVPATDKTIIQQWLDTMNGTLVDALIAEASDYQTILNGAFDNVEGCLTSRTNTFNSVEAGGVANFAAARDTARDNHLASKNCGNQCSPLVTGHSDSTASYGALIQTKLPTNHNYTYNTDRHWGMEDTTMAFTSDDSTHTDELTKTTCEENAWDDMNTKCTNTLDETVKAMYSEIQAPEKWCEGSYSAGQTTIPGDHPHTTSIASREFFSWEQDMTSSDQDAVNVWFQAMCTFNNSYVGRYKAEREACHDARRAHTHRIHHTHQLQLAFESAYCAWDNAVGETCHVYQGCYQSTKYTHEHVKGITEDVEAQIKAQQQALECVLCYGAQILADNTDLSACDANTSCQNCSPLDIEYKTPHDMKTCDEAADTTTKVCDAAWLTAEYGCFDAQAPANDCTACTDESDSWPTWPTNASDYTS